MNDILFAALFAVILALGVAMHTIIIYSVGVRHGMGVYTKVESYILSHAFVEDEDEDDDEADADLYDDDRYIGKYTIRGGAYKDGR